MKNLFLPLVLCTVLFFISCKPAGNGEMAEEPIPASDFNAVIVRHTVDSFESWRMHYDNHDSVRQAYGLEHMTLGRSWDDPNNVLVAMRASDVQRAKDFTMMPELKAVMDSAGVVGPPNITFIKSIRFDSTTNATKDRVIIAHRVKDFDTWLKAYDSETRKTRMEHGFTDRGLARGIDDPNMVYVIFAVTDREKAKARASSEELKKLMMDAGVEGAPEVFWYTVVD